jgi:hypothetical protein
MIPGSYPTILGGRQVGHHIAFQPSSGGYGGFYGDPDPWRYIWKVTSDGLVYDRPQGTKSKGYRLLYDAAQKKRYYFGDPSGFVGYTTNTIFDVDEKKALDDSAVASFITLAEAEAHADSIVAGAEQRLAAAGEQKVAPKYDVSTGAEFMQRWEAEQEASRKRTEEQQQQQGGAAGGGKKRKPKRRKPRRPPVPVWVWLVGLGSVALLVGAVVVKKRRAAAALPSGGA